MGGVISIKYHHQKHFGITDHDIKFSSGVGL